MAIQRGQAARRLGALGRRGWACLRAQRGQSMVMAVLSVMAVFGMAALLLDGGMAYARRRAAQNAADAGAFAGARQLARGGSDGDVSAAIQDYTVTRNGAASFTAIYTPGGQPVGSGSVPDGARGVAVTPHMPYTTYFARMIGFDQMNVVASAAASFGPISSPGSKVQPLARFCDQPTLEACGFTTGEEYDIWNGGGPGNFGYLSWNGANNAGYLASELDPNFVPDYVDPHGECRTIGIGCWVQGLPGVVHSAKDGMKYWQDLGLEVGTPMILVIWDQAEGEGSHTNYRIAGFAAFIVTDFRLTGNGYIMGRFVKWIVNAATDDTAGDYGVTAVHLSH